LRSDAQPYFDLLRDCGILYDTPQAAALAINSIYDDVQKWWNDFRRQEAIRVFCENFARTSSDSIKVWGNELKKVSNFSIDIRSEFHL